MLDDLTKSIKAQLYERVSSPLLASFCLSWVAWNYRLVVVLLSSVPFAEKFSYIDAHIFPTFQHLILQGSIYPLATALFLIFVYPIPAKHVYEYVRKRQRELKEIQQRIDDETPLSKEEAREIRREALKASLEFEKEIQSKSGEITRLKELIEELQKVEPISSPEQPKQLKTPTPFGPHDLNDLQFEMLKKIAQSTDGIMKKTLLAQSGKDVVLAEYNLGELISAGLAADNYNGAHRDYNLKATHAGRTLLVKRVQA